MRVSIHSNDGRIANFKAVAVDSLDIEHVYNLQYVWLAAGERYDISFTMPTTTSEINPYTMKVIGFTDLSKPSSDTAVCSQAYITSPGYTNINNSYTLPHDCSSGFDFSIVPTGARVLNPPPKDPLQFQNRVRDPYTSFAQSGPIYPISIRSVFSNNTRPINEADPQFIEFNPTTSFNGIRTTYENVPYLLQSKEYEFTVE